MESIQPFKDRFKDKVSSAESIIIVPHKGIDFDAIGSALGLSCIIKEMKKDPAIFVGDPIYNIEHGVKIIIDNVSTTHRVINRETLLSTDNIIKNPNTLFILTDVNKKGLIHLSDIIDGTFQSVIIDHHNEDESTLVSDCKYIDISVSSASEIVTRLLSLFKIKPSANIATYLLAGIYLDTNKLSKNATADTMKIVAKLMEYGASLNAVNDLFAEDFKSDRRIQKLIDQTSISTWSIAIIIADEDCEYTREELAKAADYLLKYKVDAAFVVGRISENTISISARSKEAVNVGEIMQSLGGGGNPFSGAATFENCTVDAVGKQLKKVIKLPYYRN